MDLVFLQAANGLQLTKHVMKKEIKSYPNVRLVNSITKPVNTLADFEAAVREQAKVGNCLLKGPLKKQLLNESRAGQSDKLAYSEYIIFDLDKVTLPGHFNQQNMTAKDVEHIALSFVMLLPPEFHNVSFIAQASSSLGMANNKVSVHLYFLLETPLPPKTVKLWLRSLNTSMMALQPQVGLSATGQALTYPLDPSVADNTKIIFIAPPKFEDPSMDPFVSDDDRITLVPRENERVEMMNVINGLVPETVTMLEQELRENLRKQQGLPKRKANIKTISMRNEVHEVITNPDRVNITIVDKDNPPFIRCNINGGDSNGYYFLLDDPVYMHNFKGEPIFEIAKADREFFASLGDVDVEVDDKVVRPKFPVVMRDFKTDTHYNGIFDPNKNQFDDTFPLTPTAKGSVDGFMRTHGRAPPDYVPDAQVIFDPQSDEEAINLDEVPYFVNTYRKSPFVLKEKFPQTATKSSYGMSHVIRNECPLIYGLIEHMLGNSKPEIEHFINWLGFVYQYRSKSRTAWVITGVEGTGKGLFVKRVLKPMFGEQHVPMRNIENIEEQFNMFMREALFLVVDEFRMFNANGSTLRIADKLKNNITEDTITIRAMRTDQVEIPSYTNYIFLTNRLDAVKIEETDRRYNIAPTQRTKLIEARPDIIDEIDTISDEGGELFLFCGHLANMDVDRFMATTAMNNTAKEDMKRVTMALFDEFAAAIKSGDLSALLEVLDYNIDDNVFNASAIVAAQKDVKGMLLDAYNGNPTYFQKEQLRRLYIVFSGQEEKITPRVFPKMCGRAGIIFTRQRIPNTPNPRDALQVRWNIDPKIVKETIDDNFDLLEKKKAGI